uniref:Uncharacterized protein n=1 Tax=Setaria digitata TaxID=48799 RepID=A0A915Q6X4_9BILA
MCILRVYALLIVMMITTVLVDDNESYCSSFRDTNLRVADVDSGYNAGEMAIAMIG